MSQIFWKIVFFLNFLGWFLAWQHGMDPIYSAVAFWICTGFLYIIYKRTE